MRPQITIKDIAKALGISPSTVSRALQDHPDISKKTRETVQAYAKANHYKPNAIALSLKKQRTNIIGVIVPDMVHNFFASVLAGIEDAASKKKYTVLLCQSSEQYEKEVECLDTLLASHISGLLVSISKSTTKFDHFKEALEDDLPIVLFDRVSAELNTDQVVANDYSGAYAAVSHLLETGCKRIAFYGSPEHLTITKERKRGYQDAQKDHGIEPDSELIFECDNRDAAIELTPKVMQLKNCPDSFFTVNDNTASGVIYAIKRAGLKIPEDISVCGFGDGVVARTSDPELTTVEQSGYEIGQAACLRLIERIENKEELPFTRTVIETRLIKRNSTR